MTPPRIRNTHLPALPRGLYVALGLGLWGATALAQPVKCHLQYAGVHRTLTVVPTACPAQVLPQVEGSSLVFKVVNATAPAQERGVTIETQTAHNGALRIAHQAHYLAWEASTTTAGMPHGFTGLQSVTNTDQAQTLHYWCERLAPTPSATADACPDTGR